MEERLFKLENIVINLQKENIELKEKIYKIKGLYDSLRCFVWRFIGTRTHNNTVEKNLKPEFIKIETSYNYNKDA